MFVISGRVFLWVLGTVHYLLGGTKSSFWEEMWWIWIDLVFCWANGIYFVGLTLSYTFVCSNYFSFNCYRIWIDYWIYSWKIVCLIWNFLSFYILLRMLLISRSLFFLLNKICKVFHQFAPIKSLGRKTQTVPTIAKTAEIAINV